MTNKVLMGIEEARYREWVRIKEQRDALFRILGDLEEEARAAVRTGEIEMLQRVCEDVIILAGCACLDHGPCDDCDR